MSEAEKKAHREGFLLAARSLFVQDFVFRSIKRSMDDLDSGEWVRIDERQWKKMIRAAHAALAKDEAALQAERARKAQT